MTEETKDPIEKEYVESKAVYEMMGMGQTPADPIEAAKANYHYKLAGDRFFKASDKLNKTFEDN